MFKFKTISKETIPAAFERAERYRLMNEPLDAESICHDILNVDPNNQQALRTLLLALSEQFETNLYPPYDKAVGILTRLMDDYTKTFYEGIIYERRAKALMKRHGLGTGRLAYAWFKKAMNCYEKAIELSPSRNDDAALRWNSCARIIIQNSDVEPESQKFEEHMLE
jgi:tetratricopeptide (TPR) repeat protein